MTTPPREVGMQDVGMQDVRRLPIRDYMAPGIVTCPASAQMPTVAGTMLRHQVHAVVVGDPDGAVNRLMEALDVLAAAAQGRSRDDAAGLARRPHTIDVGLELGLAARTMADERVTHLLVTEHGVERFVGMLSSQDLATALAGVDPRLARTPVPAPARPAISRSRLEEIRAGEVMHAGVVVVAAASRLTDVARAMVDHHIHAVGVTGAEGEAAVRLLTDLDLISAIAAGTLQSPAGELGATAITVNADERLNAVARVMVDRHATHVLVTGGAGARPVGVVSTRDILGVVAAAET